MFGSSFLDLNQNLCNIATESQLMSGHVLTTPTLLASLPCLGFLPRLDPSQTLCNIARRHSRNRGIAESLGAQTGYHLVGQKKQTGLTAETLPLRGRCQIEADGDRILQATGNHLMDQQPNALLWIVFRTGNTYRNPAKRQPVPVRGVNPDQDACRGDTYKDGSGQRPGHQKRQ